MFANSATVVFGALRVNPSSHPGLPYNKDYFFYFLKQNELDLQLPNKIHWQARRLFEALTLLLCCFFSQISIRVLNTKPIEI